MKTLIALALLLVATACGGPTGDVADVGSPTGGVARSGQLDGTWELVSGRGPDGDVPIVEGSRISLIIDGTSIGGTAACNSYGADGAVSGSSIDADSLSVTEMGCAPPVMESEQAYLAALADADTIERDGDVLTLRGPDVELRFEAQPPPPTADLDGTRWELESLLEGQGGDATATSASGGSLELSEDGTASGSTGCREFVGEWTESGDEILMTSLSAEGECSAELQEQDGHVLAVLGDGFTAQVEGDVLTLGSGRLGLQYRSR